MCLGYGNIQHVLIRSSPFFCVTQVASSCLLQWQLYFASERDVANPPKAISWSQKSEAWGFVGYTPAKLNSGFAPEIPEFHNGLDDFLLGPAGNF